MPTCFAPGCTSGYSTSASVHRHFFGPPRDPADLKRWERALHRKDRKLTAKSKVCDVHFEDEDIIKHYRHVVDGREVLIARGKWQLAPGAIPRLLPNLPAHFSKPKLSTVQSRSPKKPAMPCVSPVGNSSTEKSPVETEVLQVEDSSIGEVSLTLDRLSTAALPSGQWMFEFFDDEVTGKRCGIFYTRRLAQGDFLVQKTVVIDEDFGCVVNGYGKYRTQLSYSIKSAADVEHVLRQVDDLKICEGVSMDDSSSVRVHQKSCFVLSQRQVCPRCLRLRGKIRQAKPSDEKVNAGKVKIRNLRRALLRAVATREKKKKEVLELKEKLGRTSGSPASSLYLEMLNDTEHSRRYRNMLLFASRQTIDSLRVTLLSTLGIIEELRKAGVPCALTAKLDQDPLERFFGLRSFKGGEDHPTITQFNQIYGLLSLYTPMRSALACATPFLVSLQEGVGEKSTAVAELKSAVESKLSEKLQHISLPYEKHSEHDYQKQDVQGTLIYYLHGYVHKKIEKAISCRECQQSLTASPEDLAHMPAESHLTMMNVF